jgi:hypothetical protein
MRTPRPNDQITDAWEALHRGAEREGIDSPARFELSRVSTVVDVSPLTTRHKPVSPPAARRSRVRPYARTGGRTRSAHDLALEALVSTSDKARRYVGVGSPEHRAICGLCVETRSVAEIAAHLYLPLGVVKVLVGDMADAGLVVIHQPGLSLGDQSSRDFMERVLQGLRAL